MKITARQNACGYHAKSKGIGTDILIGGKDIGTDEFEPGINMSFHPTPAHPDGEFFLDLNHIDSNKTARIDKLIDGRVCHETNGFKHEFYSDGTDRIKWDMLFNSPADVPDTIRYRIKASKGLSFYKQELTAEAIADGDEYVVPEAKGSYAVYMDAKRNNKYKTGKVCHIYSPFYVDENGERSPLLDMNITPDGDNAKMLMLSNTQAVTDWINDPKRAGHKLRLDPTLGYDVQGAANTSTFANAVRYYNDDSTIEGIITSFNVYIGGLGGTFKMALANADQITGDPEGLNLIDQVEFAAPLIGLNTLIGSGAIAAATKYAFGAYASNANIKINFDTIPVITQHFYISVYANEMQGPVPVTTTTTAAPQLVSMWVEYEAAPAGNGASKSKQVIPAGVKESFGRGGSQFSKPPGMKGAFK